MLIKYLSTWVQVWLHFLNWAHLNIISIFSPEVFLLLACIVMETMPYVDISVNSSYSSSFLYSVSYTFQTPLIKLIQVHHPIAYLGFVIPCLSVKGCYKQETCHCCFPYMYCITTMLKWNHMWSNTVCAEILFEGDQIFFIVNLAAVLNLIFWKVISLGCFFMWSCVQCVYYNHPIKIGFVAT